MTTSYTFRIDRHEKIDGEGKKIVTLTLDDGGYCYVEDRHGQSWKITQDRRWGINIECVGSSLIPKCKDLADRSDLVEEQRKS